MKKEKVEMELPDGTSSHWDLITMGKWLYAATDLGEAPPEEYSVGMKTLNHKSYT